MSQHGSSVRVRFAPSPTGHLHIGSLRTALFNWLLARQSGGQFLLRIEDTDLERSLPEYTESIVRSLTWLGLDWDGDVVIQSERIAYHTQMIHQLLSQGKAYRCYCSEELLQQKRDAGMLHYDRSCWGASERVGQPHAIRFFFNDLRALTFNDLIRGTVSFEADQFDDFIIARSDGSPMYNFVVVMDDAAMNISHVIRGEDHIANTPKQIALYHACGFTPPQFAHIPLILGPAGNRLSKRDMAVSVMDYRLQGYLPDALCNYLVRLGWSHGDQEIFTRQELIDYFSLDAVGKKGAIFDQEKLNWVNGIYLRQMTIDQLWNAIEALNPEFASLCVPLPIDQQKQLVGLYQDRVKTLKEMMDVISAVAHEPKQYAPDEMHEWVNEKTAAYMSQLIDRLNSLAFSDTQSIALSVKNLCKELDIKLPQMAQPIRLALTGSTASPGVFDILHVIGKEESIRRLQRFRAFLIK